MNPRGIAANFCDASRENDTRLYAAILQSWKGPGPAAAVSGLGLKTQIRLETRMVSYSVR
jgi:hypothetical protein